MTAIKKTTTAITKTADEETLAQVAAAYPQEEGGKGILLPRLGMFSQDQTEVVGTGKNKKINILTPAGTFYTDRQSDEDEDVLDEKGKKVGTRKKWAKDEIGDTIEGIIFYKRYQLRMYDEATEEYTSSPVYDSSDEVIPLFKNKKEIDRGTPAELREKYLVTGKDGKTKSALEENRIVYVLYEGEAYQMNFRGSSMYSLLSYERTVSAPTVLTRMSSEPMEKGDIQWNKMTFQAVRKLTAQEAAKVIDLQKNAAQAIALSKASYAKPVKKSEDLDEFANELSSGASPMEKDAAKKF